MLLAVNNDTVLKVQLEEKIQADNILPLLRLYIVNIFFMQETKKNMTKLIIIFLINWQHQQNL